MRLPATLITILFAASVAALAQKPETVQEMAARADAAKPDERPGMYIGIAEHQLKSADDAYTAGKVDAGQAAINDVVTYSEKAHDAALQSNKKLKNIEIDLRKMASRLRDIKRSLNFEDQPPVQAAADRLENLRTDLLSKMFGKGK